MPDYDAVDMSPSRRLAKRDSRQRAAYIRQLTDKGQTVPRDIAMRDHATRPFIAWDGEGWTDASDNTHHYMLFGASTGDCVQGVSLSTVECLDLLISTEARHPDAFHVIFAGNYDVNMILRDVPIQSLERLKATGRCGWREYYLEYRKTKWFRVRKGDISITVYDVFSFFACSFVKALEQYIGAEDEDVRIIREGKTQRANFTYEDIDTVRTYFQSELKYLVKLCDTLREYLLRAGIVLYRWHGPGAVASTILRKRGFRHVDCQTEVQRAAQYAYAGGRFEHFQIGRHKGRVWQYDIRSAYPYAISLLPELGRQWRYTATPSLSELRPYSLYHVRYQPGIGIRPYNFPHPLFWRAHNGAVLFPDSAEGWYWGTEVISALPFCELEVIQGWEYDDNGKRPFSWIADMYQQRAQWKRNGEPAQLALKLAMNSIYGKLAQQVGWQIDKMGDIRIPTYHQLEHAGFVTATTRAAMFAAAMQHPESIIAIETDALISTKELRVDIGPDLGQWEASQYNGIMFVQSGVYWALEDGQWKARSRGFQRGDIDPARVETWLDGIEDADHAYDVDPLVVNQKRFKTMGTSLGKPEWRTWVDEPRELHPGLHGGKREHHKAHCYACQRQKPPSLGKALHQMTVAVQLFMYRDVMSTPFPLEWLGETRLEAHEEITTMEDGVEWSEVYG
jgi:hypothetical protein